MTNRIVVDKSVDDSVTVSATVHFGAIPPMAASLAEVAISAFS
jgi:hypothetical protein